MLVFFIPYSEDISKAKKFYAAGEYQKTYEYMRGHKLTEDDQELYDKTLVLLRIKRPYDSYVNYMKMGKRMESLNALVQGVEMADKYAVEAAEYGVNDKFAQLAQKIYDELYISFGVTKDLAREWITHEGSSDYTQLLYEYLKENTNVTGYSDVQTFEDELNADEVISMEENDL